MDTVKCWVNRHVRVSLAEHHVIGVSSNKEKMTAYGIPEHHQLSFDEGVGGRLSPGSR